MFYTFIKKILFLFDPETSHSIALNGLRVTHQLGFTKLISSFSSSPIEIMGLHFSNPIGLAAGLDKNGDYIDALASLGFGFIEVGTVTPKPQDGNPPPRLFRLAKEEAIINRLGFNNKGVDYLVERLKQKKFNGILGVNIGKNRDTVIEHASADYIHCFCRVAPFASYITINISSPNTPDLRQLQQSNLLQNLLRALKKEQAAQNKYVPLVVKISPDLSSDELTEMAAIFLSEKIDGIIATNTTLSRDKVESSVHANESGGLSGKPLRTRSTAIIKKLRELLQNKIPIIACGGVFTQQDAQEKFNAGADLIQVYSGFIFKGPGLINQLLMFKK
jgi:dihydroorotate dehydrogenase